MNPSDAQLTPLGYVASGPGEGYGICIKQPTVPGTLEIFAVLKAGTINHVEVALGATSATAKIIPLMKVPTQPEGCVIDSKENLYVGEEDAGIWALPDMRYIGRFSVAAGAFGATSETDGVAVISVPAIRSDCSLLRTATTPRRPRISS